MKLTSWSPSRLEKYESCPRRAKYDLIDKLCPQCFEGKLHGGFDSPQVCDTCDATIEIPGPVARGSEIDDNLEAYVKGEGKLHPAIRHKAVQKLATELRTDYADKRVRVQPQIVLTKDWKPTTPFDKGAWLRAKLDVLRFSADAPHAEVIDWKTGGIDKRTGAVRADAKYDDQLGIYVVATLSQFPVESTSAALVFVDCGPKYDPRIERPTGKVTRKELPKLQVKWTKRVKALLSDDVFAPKASTKCGWCPFQKGKGGPCPY